MTQDLLSELFHAMEAEISSFDACVDAEREFSEALERRDWPALERSMARIREIATSVKEAEARRITAETLAKVAFGATGDGIPSLAFRVPEPERTELVDTHRRLRIAAMRARLENGAIGDYAKASKDLLGDALGVLFPEKKGKIYGRSGRALEPDHDSILLNTAM